MQEPEVDFFFLWSFDGWDISITNFLILSLFLEGKYAKKFGLLISTLLFIINNWNLKQYFDLKPVLTGLFFLGTNAFPCMKYKESKFNNERLPFKI